MNSVDFSIFLKYSSLSAIWATVNVIVDAECKALLFFTDYIQIECIEKSDFTLVTSRIYISI